MKREMRVVLSVFAVLLAVAWLYPGDAPTRTEAPGVSSDVGTHGYRVFIDPVTGGFVEDPSDPMTEGTTDPANWSDEGLSEIPAPVGGGKMVDLQGRYQNNYSATVDESGNLSAGCDEPKAESTGEKE